jgi:hypothetical protein
MTENSYTESKEKTVTDEVAEKNVKKKKVWTIVGVAAIVLVVIGASTGGYMFHLSNTSPEFCASCHIMEPNVTSYLTSNDLDNIHYQAGVQCKECHDYPLDAEITSGIKYVVGDYTVDEEGKLFKVEYDNDLCLKCHISYDHVAESTDFLEKNPHDSHNGELDCNTCHVSHGDQIDYCSQCHDNGNQRLVGEEAEFRGTIE